LSWGKIRLELKNGWRENLSENGELEIIEIYYLSALKMKDE